MYLIYIPIIGFVSVVLRIYVALTIFQSFCNLVAGNIQSLKFKLRHRESNPWPLAQQGKSLTARLLPLPTIIGKIWIQLYSIALKLRFTKLRIHIRVKYSNINATHLHLRLQTRILVMHGLHWLPMVDAIIVMDGGRIREVGTYEELLQPNGAFSRFLEIHCRQTDNDDERDKKSKTKRRTSLNILLCLIFWELLISNSEMEWCNLHCAYIWNAMCLNNRTFFSRNCMKIDTFHCNEKLIPNYFCWRTE